MINIELEQKEEYSLVLNGQEIALIFSLITKQPYDVVSETVEKIKEQLTEQIEFKNKSK